MEECWNFILFMEKVFQIFFYLNLDVHNMLVLQLLINLSVDTTMNPLKSFHFKHALTMNHVTNSTEPIIYVDILLQFSKTLEIIVSLILNARQKYVAQGTLKAILITQLLIVDALLFPMDRFVKYIRIVIMALGQI